MVPALLRVAMCAVLLCIGAGSVRAQSAGAVTEGTSDYKPPTRKIARPSADAKPATQQASSLKTIGLISTIGDTFTVQTVGITVFGNEEKQFPIAAWKLNDRVAATVTDLLKKNFRVKRIPASESAFASLYEPGGLFRDGEAEYLAALRKLIASQQADYYLVITRGGSPFGTTNQSISGLGVTRTYGVFGTGGDYVHALTLLRVFDPQFKMLRDERGTIGQETFLAIVKGPHIVLSEDSERLPKEPEAALNDPRAKKLVLELLDKSLTATVPKLFATD